MAFGAKTFRSVLAVVLVVIAVSGAAFAQSLNWEGQTGVFVTPLAYSVPTGNAPLEYPSSFLSLP